MKKKVLTTIFSLLLSLFMAVSLLLGSLCFYAKQTVCNPERLTQIATEKGYTQTLYEEIAYSWENYLAITVVKFVDFLMIL